MVADWVKELTEDVLGGSPVEIGKKYLHPTDGIITIVSGQYWGTHGLSNHWRWSKEDGTIVAGYAGEWPEVKD